MSRFTAALRRRHELGARDAGTTLAELVTAMSLMTVFMAMFTTAIFTMYRGANKVTAINQTASQLQTAFVRLDKEVRYASAISAPGLSSSGSWYVELKFTNTGTPTCTQLRVNATKSMLERRTWTVQTNTTTNVTSAVNISTWVPMASGITNGAVAAGASQPFTLRAPDASSNLTFQRLAVNLVAVSGNRDAATTSVTAVTFTAANTNIATTSTGVCTEVVRP
jgi:hypothetical protein